MSQHIDAVAKQSGLEALNSRSLGSFTTAAGLSSALNTLLESLYDDQHIGIRLSVTNVSPFNNNVSYIGTFYKGGATTYYANAVLRQLGAEHEVFCYKTLDGWHYIDKFAQKEDIWKRFSVNAGATVTIGTFGSSASPYAIMFAVISGYIETSCGAYVLVRSGSTLLQSKIKEVSDITFAMDSDGVVSVTNSTSSVVYVNTRPITAGITYA